MQGGVRVMRGKFGQVRKVERQEMFKSAQVAKDKEQKAGEGRQRKKERNGVKLYWCFGLFSFYYPS